MTIQPIYNYRDEFFVNREPQIEQVKALVKEMIDTHGESVDRAIIYTGVRGAGKSWLGLYLSRCAFKENPQVKTFLVSLLPVEGATSQVWEWWPQVNLSEYGREPEEIIDTILAKLAGYLQITLHVEDDLAEKSRTMANELSQRPFTGILTFIVDSAFESAQEMLKALQDYITNPLLRTGRVVVVVTGRGTPPMWESPFLRDARQIELEQLDDAQIEQIAGNGTGNFKGEVEKIKRYSGGYPLTARLLAEANEGSLELALDQTINVLLSIIGDQKQRDRVRDYIERLSVLEDPYRDDDVLTLLSDQTPPQVSIHHARAIRDLLLTYRLLTWNTEKRGHEINPSLRVPIGEFLKDYRDQRWKAYRERAYLRFNDLATKYEKVEETHKYYLSQAEKYNPAKAG